MSKEQTPAVKPLNAEPIIGPCRLAFLNVFKPRKNDNNDRIEFSAVLLIPKTANEFCKHPEVAATVLAELIASVGEERHGNKRYDTPLYDGDVEGKFPDYLYVRVKSGEDFPPTLIDATNNNKPAESKDWRAGDWGRVKLYAYAYDKKGNQGVSLGLIGVQFTAHDEPFGRSYDAEDVTNEFGSWE